MATFFKVVCAAALFLATASASTQERRSYFKPGGELELKPVLGVESVSSVSWKKGSYVVAEFVKGAIPVTYYGKFRDRTELDSNTGRLRIRNASEADAGPFKLELNGLIQEEPYEAIIPDEVPEPEVRFYPVACDQNNDNCTVGCEGDVSKAGDVTYSWKLGDGDWEGRGQTLLLLNNATIQAVEHLSCRIENLLGSKDSKTVKNPLHWNNPAGDIAGGVIGSLVLLAILAIGGYCVYKKKFSPQESSPADVNGVSTNEEMTPFKAAGESTEPANGESAAATPGGDTPAST